MEKNKIELFALSRLLSDFGRSSIFRHEEEKSPDFMCVCILWSSFSLIFAPINWQREAISKERERLLRLRPHFPPKNEENHFFYGGQIIEEVFFHPQLNLLLDMHQLILHCLIFYDVCKSDDLGAAVSNLCTGGGRGGTPAYQ